MGISFYNCSCRQCKTSFWLVWREQVSRPWGCDESIQALVLDAAQNEKLKGIKSHKPNKNLPNSWDSRVSFLRYLDWPGSLECLAEELVNQWASPKVSCS